MRGRCRLERGCAKRTGAGNRPRCCVSAGAFAFAFMYAACRAPRVDRCSVPPRGCGCCDCVADPDGRCARGGVMPEADLTVIGVTSCAMCDHIRHFVARKSDSGTIAARGSHEESRHSSTYFIRRTRPRASCGDCGRRHRPSSGGTEARRSIAQRRRSPGPLPARSALPSMCESCTSDTATLTGCSASLRRPLYTS